MQTRRLPISTTLFFAAIALLISSAFVSLMVDFPAEFMKSMAIIGVLSILILLIILVFLAIIADRKQLSVKEEDLLFYFAGIIALIIPVLIVSASLIQKSVGLAIVFAVILFVLNIILFQIQPICKKGFVAQTVLASSISIFLIAFASIGQIYSFIGSNSRNPLALLSLIFILLIAIIYIILLYLSFQAAYSISSFFSPYRILFLWSFRGIGWISRWLNSGWRSHAIILFDAAILIWLMDRLSEYMTGSWIMEFLLKGGTISNVMYLIASYADGASLDGLPLRELLFYASIRNGTSLPWSFSGQGFFNEILSSIYVTIWSHWEQILVIWFLFEVAGFLAKASNQLTIDEVDFSDDSKQEGKKDAEQAKADGKPETSGMADLLAVNINRISELYRAVDEKRAIKSESGAGRPIEATLKSGDMSEILKNSASEKSEISLGPLSIPMGSITGLVGRLMQGPRISIALHKSKDKENEDYFYLTATLSGKEPYSWLVKDRTSLDEKSDTRSIDDMVAELAHRIFAYLAFGDQGKLIAWKAVWNFNEGLRAYRDCLHSVKKKQYFLKQAEKYFIETVEEDDDFIQAYYNLGVVYTELNQFKSAEAAFAKAIKKEPGNWEPYYALGINLYNGAKDQEYLSKAYHNGLPDSCRHIINGQYKDVINLCEYIIDILDRKGGLLNKDYAALAKAYNLMGNAQSHLTMIDCKNCNFVLVDGIDEGNFSSDKYGTLDESIRSCENSVKYSWRNLLFAEFWGDGIDNANKIVSECLIDLAEIYLYKKDASNAAKSLEQAIYLQPSDPHLYLSLGKTYSSQGRFYAAKKIFEFGVQMAPEDSRFWTCLGFAQAKLKNIKEAMASWEKVILYGPDACSDALYLLAKAYRNLDEDKSDEILRLNHASLLARLKEDVKKSNSILDCLEKMIECEEAKGGEEWKCGVASIKLLELKEDLEAWEKGKAEKKEFFEKDIYNIIRNLRIIKGTKEGFEEAHNRYTLGYLLFLYSNYRKEFCFDAEKAFNEGKAEYYRHENDLAKKHIEKSINLLKDKFLYKNKKNGNLTEKLIDERIEKAEEHFDDNDLCSDMGIIDLEKIFEIIYRDYKMEAEDCLRTAKNILFDEFRKKSSHQFNSYIQEYTNNLVESGQLYLNLGEYKKAEEHFQEAIERLEEHPQEIKRRGLYSLLSRSLRLQDKHLSSALKSAQKARILNPLGYEERKELGTTFCDLDEFDYGLEELDNAHSRKPDNPEILFDLGRYYLRRASICRDKNLRKKTLETAMDNLRQSLEILEKSQVEKRGRVRYWLGKAYSELNDPKKASPHFRILYNIRLGKEKDDIWLIAAMQLGNAYLKIKSYNESYELFDQIIKCFESYDENVTDDIVGKRLDDHFTKREIFISACLGKSYSCIDRNGDLNEALSYANLAGKYINLTKSSDCGNMSEDNKKFHEERIRRCQASCEDCIGWILYNLGYVNEAIVYLKRSVSKWADSLTYLHLAFAYESKMESCDPKSEDKTFLARKARECCQLADNFDMREEYKEVLDDMKQRLNGKKVETSAKEGNKDGLPESIGSKERCGQD